MNDELRIGEPKIYRFHNHTDAAMLACRMRADGHRAYLLDEASSWLWGPLAVGGIRVAVYPRNEEEEANNGENDQNEGEMPPEDPPPSMKIVLPDGFAIVTIALVAFGLLSQVVAVLAGLVAFAIYIGLLVLAGLLLLPVALAMVRGIRTRREKGISTLSTVVLILIYAVFFL